MTLLLLWGRKGVMNRLVLARLVLLRVHVRINIQFMVVFLGGFHHLLPGGKFVRFLLGLFAGELGRLVVLRTVIH